MLNNRLGRVIIKYYVCIFVYKSSACHKRNVFFNSLYFIVPLLPSRFTSPLALIRHAQALVNVFFRWIFLMLGIIYLITKVCVCMDLCFNADPSHLRRLDSALLRIEAIVWLIFYVCATSICYVTEFSVSVRRKY